jgi:hypothetical protein
MTATRELNTFGIGDGDVEIFWPQNAKISGSAFAGPLLKEEGRKIQELYNQNQNQSEKDRPCSCFADLPVELWSTSVHSGPTVWLAVG